MNRRWSREYRCYACASMGVERRATIRAFTGIAGYSGVAGGWPACDEHAAQEIERAMTALFRGSPGWRMTIYRINADDYGWPMMILVATITPKPPAFQGVSHAPHPS